MSIRRPRTILVAIALMFSAGYASAQAPVPYGPSINLETAKRAAAAAVAEVRKNNWAMAVAVTDTAGELVYFEKVDGTQAASITIAVEKAKSAARFKRPTKVFQDALGTGGAELRYLGLPGVLPAEGGVPIMANGAIIGAIGVSGGTGAQDNQCATAGVAAIK
jgi:glc operon protein GlcG